MGGKSNVVVTGNYEFGEILNAADTKMMTVKEGGASPSSPQLLLPTSLWLKKASWLSARLPRRLMPATASASTTKRPVST